jgi:hypothetical protein
VAESLREVFWYRVAGTLPVPGAAWSEQPVPFTSLVSQLMDAGIIDVGFAREETRREVLRILLEGIARMLGGKSELLVQGLSPRGAKERYHRIRKEPKRPPPAERLCSACGEILEIGDFGRRSANPDGVDIMCKACRRKQNQLRRRRARVGWNGPRVSEKHCPQCGRTRSAAEFHLCTSSRTGLSSWCRDCYREAHRESRARREHRGRLLERGEALLTRSAHQLDRLGEKDLAQVCGEYSRRVATEISGATVSSTSTVPAPPDPGERCLIKNCVRPAIAGDVLCRDHDRRHRRSCPFCGKAMTDQAIARGACGCCWQKKEVKEALQV